MVVILTLEKYLFVYNNYYFSYSLNSQVKQVEKFSSEIYIYMTEIVFLSFGKLTVNYLL